MVPQKCSFSRHAKLEPERLRSAIYFTSVILSIPQVNSEKSHEMCGLCSFNPERRQQQLNSTDSLSWWKQNQVQSSQCTIQEPSRQQQQENCDKQYKHKVT